MLAETMDFAESEENARAFSDQDGGLNLASATGPAPENKADNDIRADLVEEDMPVEDTADRRDDLAEYSDGEQDACHRDGAFSSNTPTHSDLHHQQMTESGEGEMFRSDGDMFRLDEPDLRRLCPVSGPALSGSHLGPEFPCDDLPLVFSVPPSEDESAKVFSCHLCSFKTAFKNSLVNHQAVHSDVRPWICEICDYAAKRKQDLKKHLQTMHGMIVDSLALRPGINPPPSSVSSSSLPSPVDTKPVLLNNVAVSSDQCVAPVNFPGSSYSRSSASGFPSQLGGVQQLPSTAKLNPMLRSVGMPAVGQFIGDKFPFNQFYGDGGSAGKSAARSSAEAFVSHTQSSSREESDSDHAERDGTASFSADNANTLKQENSRQAPASREAPQDDGRDQQVWSASERSANRKRCLSFDQHGTMSTETTRAGQVNRKDLKDVPRGNMPSHSEDAESIYSSRKASVDSACDRVPTKVSRFQSPVSDSDYSPHISSQSDQSMAVCADMISSTVSHSRAPEMRKSFHCVHCDILFFESALYLMHMGLHDNSNPWKCSVCGRTFFEKYSFTSHFINQH